jgi:DNA-binding MarR family transcriptional regulator
MKQIELTTYQTGVLQARAHRALRSFMQVRLKEHKLSSLQWSVLGLAFDYTVKGGVKVSQLAQLLNVEISLVTATLNQLEPRGLLERISDEEDSRAKRVITTRAGEKLLKKIEPKLHRQLEHWLEDIHDQQLGLYIRTLQQLARKEQTDET